MNSLLLLILTGNFLATSAFAARTPLSISVVRDLDIGEAPQGDVARTIAATNNPSSARFLVTGDANTAYTIMLPSTPVSIFTGAGGVNETMTLRAFKSLPSEGSNGVLDDQGKQTLYVGATRDGLATNQAPGSYSGQFLVEVVF